MNAVTGVGAIFGSGCLYVAALVAGVRQLTGTPIRSPNQAQINHARQEKLPGQAFC